MNLIEFWASSEQLAIHCPTKEQARELAMRFDAMDKTWCTGASYIGHLVWDGPDECYSNGNQHCDKEWYEENGYAVIEYRDIEDDNADNGSEVNGAEIIPLFDALMGG